MAEVVEFKFHLKEKVKDSISGFTGCIVARCQWLHGCMRYQVMADHRDRDGKTVEEWFDETALVSAEKKKRPNERPPKRHGGRADPMRSPDPR